MAAEVARNMVFRSIAGKWRGPFSCSSTELGIGLVASIPIAFSSNALFGLLGGGAAIGALVAWRRADGDRSDYVSTFLRRFDRVRAFNANEPDSTFVPMRWRETR